MIYLILAICCGGIALYGVSFSSPDDAAVYNPSNPISLVLFVVSLLITGILWSVEWSTLRGRVLLLAFKTNLINKINRFFAEDTSQIKVPKFVEDKRFTRNTV